MFSKLRKLAILSILFLYFLLIHQSFQFVFYHSVENSTCHVVSYVSQNPVDRFSLCLNLLPVVLFQLCFHHIFFLVLSWISNASSTSPLNIIVPQGSNCSHCTYAPWGNFHSHGFSGCLNAYNSFSSAVLSPTGCLKFSIYNVEHKHFLQTWSLL